MNFDLAVLELAIEKDTKMAKHRLAVALLLAVALGLLTTGALSQSIFTNPPAGSTLNTFPDPAEFECVVFFDDVEQNVEWYINGLDISDPLISEGYSIIANSEGTMLSVEAPIGPGELLPPSLNITCAPPGSPEAFYANFTLIIPLVELEFQPVEGEVVAEEEGSNVLVCVDAYEIYQDSLPPFPITVDLRVLPQSTASADDYIFPSLVSLSFDGIMNVCVNVSLVADGDDAEDVEIIVIQLENSSSPLARIIVGFSFRRISIACSENALRLTGGADSAQGIVEICNQQVWGSVCTLLWDQPDAQVVCRQLGFVGQPSAYVNVFGGIFPEQPSAYVNVFGDINFIFTGGNPVLIGSQCVGTELDLLNCTRQDGPSPIVECATHNAAVDCAGRSEPLFNFGMAQVNVVEGDTLEVCVVLESGVITVPLMVEFGIVFIQLSPLPEATFGADFITTPPLLTLTFNPGQTSKCVNVTIIDDEDLENNEEITFELVSSLQTPLRQRILIIDNDMDCGNGSVCVDRAQATTSCVDVMRVCDGFMDCVDNSDETNCPVICPEDQYTCRSEGTCLNLSMRCDGIPDCVGRIPAFEDFLGVDEFDGCPPDGCVPGSVVLVGGVREGEGVVKVCVDGNRVPVSFEGSTILGASLLCRESGLGQGGYPYPSTSLPTTTLVTVSCTNGATSLSECDFVSAPLTDRQASITCIAATCTDGSVRIISGDGLPSNEGRVEVCHRGVWGAILDDNWTNRDAAVVCRQMGYTSQGAMPIFGAVYDDEPLPLVANGFSCAGNESSLLDCPGCVLHDPPLQATDHIIFNIVGVRCDDYQPSGCKDLDVRLTYRGASGYSGQFEICNNNIWRRTCRNSNFNQSAAAVACNQLFNFTNDITVPGPLYTPVAEVLSETGPVYDMALFCGFSDRNLSSCSSELGEEVCNPVDQPTVTCYSPPVIYVSPVSTDRAYRVETGYTPSVSCAADPNTNPPSISSVGLTVDPIGSGDGRRKRRDFSTQVPLVSSGPVFPGEGIFTSCSATNSFEGAVVNITIEVVDEEGPPEFAFIQMSSVSSQRFLQIPNTFEISLYLQQLPGALQMLMSERTPGVQRISGCALIERRPIDVVRGLDRIECLIEHYNRPDETVGTTAAQVARRLATLLPLITPTLFNIIVIEPAQVAFTSPESIAVEGDDDVTICLSVISGEVTTPTNITLIAGSFVATALEGIDYNIAEFVEYVNGFPVFTLTLLPGATEACFDVSIVDDDNFGGESENPVKQVIFYYFSSSPTVVARIDVRHTLVILDNDRNCTADAGLGSRLCANRETLSVDCTPPSLVCDYITADCPDVSDELNCPSPIEDLVNQTISEETYTNVSEVVSSFAALSENRTFLQTMLFLNDVSIAFDSIADLTNTTNTRINETVVRNLGQTLNSLVQWQSSSLEADTTSGIVESFEEVATIFAQQSNLTVNFTDVTIVIELGTTETFMSEGRTEDFTSRAGVPASIALPPELFNQVPAGKPIIGVYFAVYENPALLPAMLSAVVKDNVTVQETFVGTPIVAATVGSGIDFGGIVPLNPPVVITLGLRSLPENSNINPSTARCASWDFDTVSWTTDGCTTTIVDNSTFSCSCTHLTNFCVLVDICRRVEDCVNNETVDQVLSFISYIGVVLSCVGLVITIITLLISKKLRERDNSKYHIQLSLAILCMLIVFAVGIERVEVYGGCVLVSVLIHYFSLVSVMWMGAEALLMFQKLVIVFMNITTKFIVILSLVCWLFPLIVVLIPMIIDVVDTTPETDLIISRNVDPITGDITGGYCFLKHPGVFFGAFLGPIFAGMLFNLVIFIWVIVILVKHTRGKMERSSEKMSSKTALRLLLSISGVMFLFGLTWLFAALTIGGVLGSIFQILFTVFVSFQGFYIFLFFVVFNAEARESWKEILSCGRYQSDLLRPSGYKNTSSASTRSHKAKRNTKTSSAGTEYNTANFDSEAGTLPEKIDLSEKQTDVPSDIVVESQLDEDEKTTSGASPVAKSRVKRYFTRKVSKKHVEEYEINDENEDNDQEVLKLSYIN